MTQINLFYINSKDLERSQIPGEDTTHDIDNLHKEVRNTAAMSGLTALVLCYPFKKHIFGREYRPRLESPQY